MTLALHLGDCLEVMRTMPDASVDAVVCDPPYGLAFMGKRWDYDVPSVEIWAECLRVLKPGGHLLAFAGTRTQHRMAVRIEDAGFEIRDMIAWVYGSGFPKSMNVATAIAKLAEPKAEPKAEEVEFCQWLKDNSTFESVTATLGHRFWNCEIQIVNAATKQRPVMARRALVPTAAKWQEFKAQHRGAIPPRIEELVKAEPYRGETPGDEWTPGKGSGTAGEGNWAGWGTALKPALEPITMARKPLEGTVAANVLAHGTGALNVDGCRVGTAAGDEPLRWEHGRSMGFHGAKDRGPCQALTSPGRWPSNLIHDGSDEVVWLFPQTTSGGFSGTIQRATNGPSKGNELERIREDRAPDTGSAARFFYTAKASKADRDEGVAGVGALRDGGRESQPRKNHHPTVKPTDLMRYLCRLVTPPGGVVLDPFMGSGSTGKAAMLEGFGFIGIEREAAYHAIAEGRIRQAGAAGHQPDLFAGVAA